MRKDGKRNRIYNENTKHIASTTLVDETTNDRNQPRATAAGRTQAAVTAVTRATQLLKGSGHPHLIRGFALNLMPEHFVRSQVAGSIRAPAPRRAAGGDGCGGSAGERAYKGKKKRRSPAARRQAAQEDDTSKRVWM